MNTIVLVCCLGIGLVAGLRSMTPPAVVSWAAFMGWINVTDGPFWFLASWPVLVLLTAWAVFELVLDKTSKIGPRTEPLGLIFRAVTSGFCGAVLSSSAGMGYGIGLVFGWLGGAIGTYGGYHCRKSIIEQTSLRDLQAALAEDVIAISLGVAFVSLARS
ncbi:MAG: DUF4126 family protein [Pyrinomonadaceae bacterium]